MKQESYYSHGKLLLSGEYLVLDGATALAIPVRYGQILSVQNNNDGLLHFTSKEKDGSVWFRATFNLEVLKTEADPGRFHNACSDHSNEVAAETVWAMLCSIANQRPEFIKALEGATLESTLEFDRSWGLGSSSTFINNLAQWSDADPYQISADSLGGSGYDIACADSSTPLFYRLHEGKPIVEPTHFNPAFKDQLYFVHLNKKQNSRLGISRYKERGAIAGSTLDRISTISRSMGSTEDAEEFRQLIEEHESIISEIIGLPTVKTDLFIDVDASFKSLGAWGGDFVLLQAENDPREALNALGYTTVIPFEEMTLIKG